MNPVNEPGGAKVQIGANLIYDPENNVFFLNAFSQQFSTIGGYYGSGARCSSIVTARRLPTIPRRPR
jgi:hypothetical protein